MENKVIGITHGQRRETGAEYTIIFYINPVNENYGEGFEGKKVYIPKNITNVKVGDCVKFFGEPSADGSKVFITEVIPVKPLN